LSDDDLHFLNIEALGKRYRSGDLSPVEVTRTFLDRIASRQADTSAYITVTDERAMADARAAEEMLRAGNDLGPLHGIPIALKDLCDTAGIRTTSGSRIREHYVPDTSSTVAKKLARAGTVLLGKTNLVEFAFGPFGVNEHFGTPPNPWDPACVPGGSSSGSGVAVSGGLATAAIGTDTGGSVRIPSAFCGIVGLKTTSGRVGTSGIMPLSRSLDTAGPMARSVRDAALVYSAIAGPEEGDDSADYQPVGDVLAEIEVGMKGMRIGVSRDPFFEGADTEVAALVEKAIDQLSDLGASVVEFPFPEAVQAEAEDDNLTLLRMEGYAVHRDTLAQHADQYSSRVRARLEATPELPAADILQIQERRTGLMASTKQRLGAVEAVVGPTLLTPAPRLVDLDKGEPARLLTRLVNWLGLCGVSVPCGFTSKGLPVGVQLIGKPFDEVTILRIARAYEASTDWHERRPPGF
jgi:aspartyl-tRNA(Asn)/glutamyl-tRNA(Gln) amidotransferase subunit A